MRISWIISRKLKAFFASFNMFLIIKFSISHEFNENINICFSILSKPMEENVSSLT